MYQSPMGKVKPTADGLNYLIAIVSIPYGKGKEEMRYYKLMARKRYQPPMGKVKRRRSHGLYLRLGRYQSPMGKVKKRQFEITQYIFVVSIPYGKGKEQHFVLCSYYNP